MEGMTKGSMDEMTEQKEESIISSIKAFIQSPSKAPLADGVFTGLSTYGLMEAAIKKLRDLIKKRTITWKEPFIQLEYDFDVKDRLTFVQEHPEYLSLVCLTKGFTIIKEAGSPNKISNPWKENIEGLTEEQLAAGFEPSEIIQLSGTAVTPDGTEDFVAELLFAIRPLIIDKTHNTIFYPIHTGIIFRQGNPSTWPEDSQTALWNGFLNVIKEKAAPYTKELKAKGEGLPSIPKSSRAKPIRADWFKTPGRLFDTPRHIVAQNKTELFPEINRWYQQTAFNRTVGMAAAALTRMDTREVIMDWQSATVEEVADLVFCRSEEGTLAHGQNRDDILKAFEALRAIPIPIVKIDWKKIGTDRNPRWIKEYKLRVASLLQSYGAVFVEKKSGKQVFAADPVKKKDLVKAKPDRRKTTRELVKMNPAEGLLQSFPADRYTLKGFEWRWNTDVAEDFICPQVALDEKDRPRLRQIKGRHIEGSRFIMLNKQYFTVQKHLRAAGSTYGPRLLDMIVSEKKHITNRGKGAVWVEIEAEKIIKWLDLWEEYQKHSKRVIDERIAPAIMTLIKEKVLLPESGLVPQKDKNEDRRKNPYYRWKVAELWTTVALVPEEEAKDIEADLVAQAEAEEAALALSKDQNNISISQPSLPGIIEEAPMIPSGSEIRSAREAAGINIREFARIVDGPAIGTWSHYETGKPIRIKSIKPEVWERVKNFIAQHKKDDSEGKGKDT
jgi:hypothetical protein